MSRNDFAKILIKLWMILSAGTAIGCNSVYEAFNFGGVNASNNNSQETSSPTPVTYAEVNAQIFAPICIRCHSVAGGNPGGVNLETYQNVLNNLSRVQNAVNTNFMPLNGPPLSQNLKNLLNGWIANGAPQNESPASLDEETKTSEEVYFQTE